MIEASVWTRPAFAVLALLAAAPALSQENREFRDWIVNCDASLACEAETRTLDGAPTDFLLRVTRSKTEANWNLVLVANAARPERPYNIFVDLLGASVDVAAYGKPTDIHLLGAKASQLLGLMGPATEAGFEFYEPAGNPYAPRFSLSGLSASLLWIDEMQGRVGSSREAGNAPEGLAALDFGQRDLSNVPADLLVLHGQQGDCEGFNVLPDEIEFIVAKLSEERTLHLAPCSSGAYNSTYAAYIASNRRYRRTWFADYSDRSSWTATPYLVNPYWDDAAKRLTTFNKGRVIGDCGSIGEWRSYDGYLRLEKFYYKGDCDGEGGPDAYPLVYQAEPWDG